MPYLLTTTRPQRARPVERRTFKAFETLEGVRLAVLDACKALGVPEMAAATAGRAAWAGGLVGPLPDDSVLKVEPVTRRWLLEATGLPGDFNASTRTIVTAYNRDRYFE